MTKNLFIWLSMFTLAALACGMQSNLPAWELPHTPTATITATTDVKPTSHEVEYTVKAESLNLRACASMSCAADSEGLRKGDVVTVYLACGEKQGWVSVNANCTGWVWSKWLEEK